MRSTAHSAASSPSRRALHERTPSETNKEASSSTLRLVTEAEKEDPHARSISPYPTRPGHVLSPSFSRENSITPVSDIHDVSSVTRSSATVERSLADLWDLPYIFDPANTRSQLWEGSSRSSFPDPSIPAQEQHHTLDENPEFSDDDDIAVLPTDAPTIKTVISEPSSPDSHTVGTSGARNPTLIDSSPNIVPIGPSSSPNFIPLDSSSMNFVRIGNSSSNTGSATRSNSVVSMNSMGTVVRHIGASPWIHPATSDRSSSHTRSRSESFRSTPPIASIQSSSLASHSRSRSGSGAASARSGFSGSDIHAIIDSGIFIQYPRIRGPASSMMTESRPIIPGSSAREVLPEEPSEHWSRNFSAVSSQWSTEYSVRRNFPAGERAQNSRVDSSAFVSQKSSSSEWLVTDSEGDEHLDHLTTLPSDLVRPRNPAVPSSSSSGSRSSSQRSSQRPATGSSYILNVVPTWARLYYQSDGQAINTTLSMIEGSRPSSSRSTNSGSNMVDYMSTALTQPRMRPHEATEPLEITEGPQGRKASDPRDPRSHWAEGLEAGNNNRPGTSRSQMQGTWSPHLFPDRQIIQHKTSTWTAVSMDSRTEPAFGRRNIQVYSFCLGIIFPLAWIVAAFLPLPPKPNSESASDLERALKVRTYDIEQRRYENARWWRNLNRVMIPLGIVIIALIITLAVVGTKLGF
ncbi:hypothetical protein MPDQ_005968 [Monascus purpureus]|uniref:Serine-rich protein n=1 Tax=Monascus purpureus TaxID=5098 RepID=A0A507QVP3_MONPU|nr:hypothetical protein MPDQ_005968 [Monascus purpureus]BDD61861.1 hypothetical protein MAP00_006883 [Monascus purpureus]